MGNLSAHFSKSEFRCQCGCGNENPSKLLISMLEKLYSYMNAKAIIISSGYRCPKYSVSVGGMMNDAHTRNMAADLCVQKQTGGFYSSWDIAEAAERLGFKGIGIINDTYIHLDTRGHEPYANSFWFGNEVTGATYNTFQRGTVFAGQVSKKVEIGVLNKELQRILNRKGHNLAIDGIVGKYTLEAVKNYIIELGDSGELCKWVQQKLNSLGYDCGAIDGFIGKKTIKAINDWQRDKNLGQGYLGGTDWDILLKD